ncbi:MAG: S1 RNA-binding domain-containing protein, partial [Clostridiales bacterium]|nr:S1 RNA-binding domain-containing protein [Clostridiales bacterium]
ELTGGKDGMLHISKMADHRVEKVEDVMNIGDEVEVKVNEIDSQGRVNLIRNDMVYTKPPMSDSNRPGDHHRRPPRRDGRPHSN